MVVLRWCSYVLVNLESMGFRLSLSDCRYSFPYLFWCISPFFLFPCVVYWSALTVATVGTPQVNPWPPIPMCYDCSYSQQLQSIGCAVSPDFLTVFSVRDVLSDSQRLCTACIVWAPRSVGSFCRQCLPLLPSNWSIGVLCFNFVCFSVIYFRYSRVFVCPSPFLLLYTFHGIKFSSLDTCLPWPICTPKAKAGPIYAKWSTDVATKFQSHQLCNLDRVVENICCKETYVVLFVVQRYCLLCKKKEENSQKSQSGLFAEILERPRLEVRYKGIENL